MQATGKYISLDGRWDKFGPSANSTALASVEDRDECILVLQKILFAITVFLAVILQNRLLR